MSNLLRTKKSLGRRSFADKPQNSFKQIKPILEIIRILGGHPYRMSSKGVEPTGKWQYLWAATRLTLIIVPIVKQTMSFSASKSRNLTWKVIIELLFLSKEYLFCATMLLDYIHFFCRYNTTSSFFKKLQRYDDDIGRLGHPRRQSIRAYWTLTIIGALSTLAAFVFALILYFKLIARSTFFFNELTKILIEIYHLAFIVKWLVYVHMIRQRFEHLNAIIVGNLSFRTGFSNREAITSRDVLSLHANLIEIVKIFNNLAGFNLLLSIAALLVNALLHTKHILVMDGFSLSYYLVLNSFAQLFGIFHACTITAKEANGTGRRLVNFQGTLTDSINTEDKMNLAMYLFHNRVTFTGADFFDINLLTFRGLVVVYFTFLLVISDSGNSV